MSHHDYIGRSPQPRGKKNAAAQTAPIGLPLKTKLVGLLTLTILIGFVGFLWSIKDSAPPAAANNTPANAAAPESVTLPKPPEKKWHYVDDLKTKEVAVGEYEVEERGPWKMQCASFRTEKQAESLRAKFAFVGLEAQIVKSSGTNGVYYKVIMGPYERKREAEKDRHKLKRNNINNDCQIWLWG